jgi:hypothetical protein
MLPRRALRGGSRASHSAPRGAWQGATSGVAPARASGLLSARPLVAAIYGVPHALWAVGQIAKRAVEASPALAAVQLDTKGRVTVTRGSGALLARARQLYAEAYEPLRFSPSLAVLELQAPLLAAAEALEKRADGIQQWPFSDALLARAVVIATSVVAAVITRLAQRFLGL